MPDFLLEIGCEEIPARMIKGGAERLGHNLAAALQSYELPIDISKVKVFATPRRLGVYLADLPHRQPDLDLTELGPSWKVAFKNNLPTTAAEAFAKKYGTTVSSLEKVDTPKGEYVAVRVTRKGSPIGDVLKKIAEDELNGFYWEKTMYWRGKVAERFVRPIRWMVAILDDEVLPIEFAGLVASRTSRGHRTLSAGDVEIRSPKDYVANLQASMVLADPVERAKRIDEQAKGLEAEKNVSIRTDRDLQSTVVYLTEWPSMIMGSFDREFLQLPEEVLVTVMRDHQKYFAVEDAEHNLLPHFLAVLNTDADRDGLIRHGNERVLRARFSDARFFWETDQKRSLLERLELLRHVTFQKDLGSYYEKTRRVQRLCSWLSEIIKQSGMAVRAGVIHKAACLAKTDLTTELVKEFTELQGIVGGLYARAQKLDSSLPEATRFAIADAIYDHYKPESTEDDVPRSIEGAVLSVGDKADTIAGMFALGLVPSGSKDPFALRRQANAIVKVIDKYKLPLRLSDMMRDARAGYQGTEAEKKFVDEAKFSESVRTFFRDRLEFYLKDVRGYAYDVVKAVLAAEYEDVVDALARAEGLTTARESHRQDFDSVCASFKRIKNILKQAEEKGIDVPKGAPEGPGGWLLANLPDAAEVALYHSGINVWASYEQWRRAGDYRSALSHVALLGPVLARFFDEVMVMVEDPHLRANRLGILQMLYSNFSTVADFSEIVTEGKA